MEKAAKAKSPTKAAKVVSREANGAEKEQSSQARMARVVQVSHQRMDEFFQTNSRAFAPPQTLADHTAGDQMTRTDARTPW